MKLSKRITENMHKDLMRKSQTQENFESEKPEADLIKKGSNEQKQKNINQKKALIKKLNKSNPRHQGKRKSFQEAFASHPFAPVN